MFESSTIFISYDITFNLLGHKIGSPTIPRPVYISNPNR